MAVVFETGKKKNIRDCIAVLYVFLKKKLKNRPKQNMIKNKTKHFIHSIQYVFGVVLQETRT